jgi:hypothetical protein
MQEASLARLYDPSVRNAVSAQEIGKIVRHPEGPLAASIARVPAAAELRLRPMRSVSATGHPVVRGSARGG